MKTRHNNKFNKKDTHVERKDLRLDKQWLRAYEECILDSEREVWIFESKHVKQADLITW